MRHDHVEKSRHDEWAEHRDDDVQEDVDCDEARSRAPIDPPKSGAPAAGKPTAGAHDEWVQPRVLHQLRAP